MTLNQATKREESIAEPVTCVSAIFSHLPGDHVTVTHLGLNYKARVTRCILTHSSQTVYEVEYPNEGEIRSREFYADELS